jgi:aspartyl-tRNA(Asn)/glutamyl-tRNA(Gln) amidotransferase subunit C
MAVDSETIARLADLSRLAIAADEAPVVSERLTAVLGMLDRLQGIDTDGVEPMAHPLDARQRLRRDEVTEADQRERFQAIAPAAEAGLYLVPRVIE